MISRLKRILISVLSLCIILCGAVFAAMQFGKESAAFAEVSWESLGEIKDYSPNQKPEASLLSRKVTINGEEFDYDKLNVIYPDGTAYVYEGEAPTLNQVGKYTFIYYKEAAGKVYSAEEIVYVNSKSVVVGENSSAEYGKGDKAKNDTSEGLLFSLAKNEEIIFNDIIDVSEMKAVNYESKPLISLYFNPSNAGSNDVGSFWLVLTDAEDSSVTLTIQISHLPNMKRTVVKAGGENQVLTGVEGTSNIHRGDLFGTYSYCSLASFGLNGVTEASDFAIMSIYFDAEDNTLKIQDSMGAQWSGGKIDTVADFDSKEFFPTELWRGFPSGKAKLKMYASDWANPSMQVCVTQLYGHEDLQSYLSSDVKYEEPPVITVEAAKEYEKQMPQARLGEYYYKIPSATATDFYGNICETKVSVLYENAITCEITEGSFKTDKSGVYVIRYKAADASGNESVKELYVRCGGAVDDITAEFDISERSVRCGEVIAVPVPRISGGSGEIGYSLRVYDELGEEYEYSGGFVRTKNKGELTFEYALNEIFTGYSKTERVTVGVVDYGEPFLAEEIVLPKYFVSGAKYTLPEFKAFIYEKDVLTEKTLDMYMNGQKYAAFSEYVPSVSVSGEPVELTFACGDKTVLTKSVPTILAYNENGELTVENYFLATTGSYTVTKEMSGIGFTASENYSMNFARALNLSGFSFTMLSVAGGATFERIEFTVTDSVSEAKSIAFAINNDNGYYLEYDGVATLTSQNFNNGEDSLTFTLNGGELKYGSSSVSLTKYVGGTAFEGFPSNEVYLGISVYTSENCTLKIKEINGSSFNDGITDSAPPAISIESKASGNYAINQLVNISKATAFDLLDPNSEVTVTVTSPNGGIVTSTDGVPLDKADCSRDYEIKLGEYGKYVVTYNARDGKNNSSRSSYTINVNDDVPPVMSFEKGFKTACKIGEIYVIPEYTVSDDVSSAENITCGIYVLTPFDKVEMVSDKTYTFRAEGEYTLYIFACDEAYNYTFYTVKVTVTK